MNYTIEGLIQNIQSIIDGDPEIATDENVKKYVEAANKYEEIVNGYHSINEEKSSLEALKRSLPYIIIDKRMFGDLPKQLSETIDERLEELKTN